MFVGGRGRVMVGDIIDWDITGDQVASDKDEEATKNWSDCALKGGHCLNI